MPLAAPASDGSLRLLLHRALEYDVPEGSPCPLKWETTAEDAAEFMQLAREKQSWVHRGAIDKMRACCPLMALQRSRSGRTGPLENRVNKPAPGDGRYAVSRKRIAEGHLYTCWAEGEYRDRRDLDVPAEKRRRQHESKKYDCGATIKIRHLMPKLGEPACVIVEYNWRHTGHDPRSLASIRKDRLPPQVRQHLKGLIRKGLSFESIKAQLRLTDQELLDVRPSLTDARVELTAAFSSTRFSRQARRRASPRPSECATTTCTTSTERSSLRRLAWRRASMSRSTSGRRSCAAISGSLNSLRAMAGRRWGSARRFSSRRAQSPLSAEPWPS
jgi:hypothetical protein